MNSLLIPAAYKYVAIAVMLTEINHCAAKLELEEPLPIVPSELRTCHVAKPFLTGFGGTLETERYSFIFFKSGRLRTIQRINRWQKMPIRELQNLQSRERSLIDTNGAYTLATNWLALLSVNLGKLETEHRHTVEQKRFYPDATNLEPLPNERRRVVLLPVFNVVWGNPVEPVITVSVYGPTKEMLGIYQDDESFSERPKELIANVEALLAVQDEEFFHFTDAERKQLIIQFATQSQVGGLPRSIQKTNVLNPASQ